MSPKPPSVTILGVTGSPIEILGEVTLSITILGRNIEHTFFVTEKKLSFGVDLILGIDFIIKHQLIYSPFTSAVTFLQPSAPVSILRKTQGRLSLKRRKRVRFLLSTTDSPIDLDSGNPLLTTEESEAFIIDEEKHFPLFMYENVEIPGFSEMFVKMKLPRNMLPSEVPYYVQGHIDQSLQGIYVARMVVFLSKAHVLVRVVNVTPSPILLRKNLRIAQLHPSAASQPNDLISETGSFQNKPFVASVESEDSRKITPDDFDLAHIPEPYRTALRDLLMKHSSAFGTSLADIKGTNVYQHDIELEDTTPAYKNPYRLPFAHRDIVKSEVDKLLASGIVEPAVSPYNAPILLAKKSSGGYRLVSDLRLLNQKIKDDKFPNSFASDAIDRLAGCTIFSTLDLLSSFHQIPLAPSSRPYTAFTADNVHLQYRMVPFGMKNSSAALNRALTIALSGLHGTDAFLYVDDILIASRTYSEHLEKLDRVLKRLIKTNFVLRPSKCSFMQQEIKYLGHIIDKHGVRPDPFKVQAVQNFPRPTTVKEVRQFLGFINFYRRSIDRMSELAAPLVNLTRKNVDFVWTDDCQKSFDKIKSSLLNYPVLRFPDFTKDFFLSTDASDFAISAVLEQQHGNDLLPIAFISRQLSKAERSYSTTEKECLAIFWALEHLRCYLLGHRTHVLTDHQPLRGVFKATNPGGRLTRWSLKLSAYDFDVTYVPGRLNVKADVLSRIKTDSQ